MLKRIQKIENIGKFANCSAGGCEFNKETIIFGFNTQGKSTLTAIFRSIKTGNNDILIGRKTFGAQGNKKVDIDFEDNGINEKYVFQNRTWNKHNPNILIFDSKFITENIFNGEVITFDQQKKLSTIIIGKKGQNLSNEIKNLQEKSDNFTLAKSEKTREFSRHFPNIPFDKFKLLPQRVGIDDAIKKKDEEIKFEREKEDIKKIVRSHIQNLSSFDFSEIRTSLSKTFDTKQTEIETHIKSNFSTEKNAENFLSEGLDFLKEKPIDGSKRTCVLCGQKLEDRAEFLISLYAKFFKGGYKNLQVEIEKSIASFRRINIGVALEKIRNELKDKGLDIGLDEQKIGELSNLKRKFEDELNNKKDLNYVVNFDTFDLLESEIKKIQTTLEDLERKRINIPSIKTILQLEKEKIILELTKKRHEPIWDKFCKDLEIIETEAKKIRKERDAKRKELEDYCLFVFSIHKKTINQFCNDMGADFEIDDFKPLRKIVGKEERIFAIKFFASHKVSIHGDKGEHVPNFRNTLSESDKRLLAFAFFLSLLSHDKNLDQKIIIFDDPMSSFDRERRRKTIHLIADISCKHKDTSGTEKTVYPKQKIVLTHEDYFAKELVRLMPNACSLKIEECIHNKQKSSKIIRADFSQEFPDDDISYRIEKIKKILDTRSFTEAFELDCRKVLENIFKKKYHLKLKDLNKGSSIRTFVMTLFDSNDTKFQKFIRLCDDLNIELHDNNSSNSSGDKETILKEFFECLELI